MDARWWAGVAAACGLAGVALGAFGAHALTGRLDARGQALWQTATMYLLVHAAALLAVSAVAAQLRGQAPQAAPALLGVGMVLFAGSLYLLALGAPRWLGMVAPVGGTALLAGWAMLLYWALRGG